MTVTSDTDTWMLTDEQLTDRVALAFKTKARAEAACATLVAAVQDRDLVSLAGASSGTSWLANLTGIARGEAAKTLRQADNLNTEVEPTVRVWTTGDLPTEKASTICQAINPPSTSCREVPPVARMGRRWGSSESPDDAAGFRPAVFL